LKKGVTFWLKSFSPPPPIPPRFLVQTSVISGEK
jgi:hypothetical protein